MFILLSSPNLSLLAREMKKKTVPTGYYVVDNYVTYQDMPEKTCQHPKSHWILEV